MMKRKKLLCIALFSLVISVSLNAAQKVPVMPGPRIITSQPANPAKAAPAAQPTGAIIPIAPKPAVGASVSTVIPIAPKPTVQQTNSATSKKLAPAREIKSENLKDFDVAQWVNGKTNFNMLTNGRILKVAVMPGELVHTSSHFRVDHKKSKPDKDGRETWKIHARKNGNGWIKIVEKKDGIKKYHFTIHD